jgi:hypothetical protein
LLTRDAVRASGLGFAGWIANKLGTEMPLANANIETISSRFGAAPLGIVPAGADPRSIPIPDWASEAAINLVSP